MKRERRNYGGVDTMTNTTTAAQRRDRRKELEEKYGFKSSGGLSNANPIPPTTRDTLSYARNSETLHLNISTNNDDPLLNLNNNNNQQSSTTTVTSGSLRRAVPPTNIFNDV